jgi:ABC-type multidrug transport system ATPase subunit
MPAGVRSKVDTVIEVLRLQNCKDTVVGNGVIRGISGGEKRRLSLAEMLVGATGVHRHSEYTARRIPRGL